MTPQTILERLFPGPFWVDLRHRTTLELSGPDARRYLNGQCTNDISRLPVGGVCHACILTAKGKMCADVWVTARENGFRIDAQASLEEELPARLERYLIADDATLDLLEAGSGPWHWIPPFDQPDLVPPVIDGANPVPAFRYQRPGFDFPPGIEPTGTPLTPEEENVLRVLSGRPLWGVELDENTIPVEAGLESISIRYDKGCYIGQEVISRIKSIGRVNRQLRLLSMETGPLPVAGTVVWSGEPAVAVGSITSAVEIDDADSPVWALAWMKRSAGESPVVSVDGLRAVVHGLPFAG